jgi:hypothetical protein
MMLYGMPIRAAERAESWPTLGGLIAALLQAQARLIREAGAWVK